MLHEDGAIEIASVGDRPPRTIFARMLTDIIEPRAKELLALIRDELRRAGLDKQIPAGFVLAGGGARLYGLDRACRAIVFICRCALPSPRAWRYARTSRSAGVRNRCWSGDVRSESAAFERRSAREIWYQN